MDDISVGIDRYWGARESHSILNPLDQWLNKCQTVSVILTPKFSHYSKDSKYQTSLLRFSEIFSCVVNHKKLDLLDDGTFRWHLRYAILSLRFNLLSVFFTTWMYVPMTSQKIQPKKTVAKVTHLFVDKGKSWLWMNAWVRHFSACGFLFAAITCHEKPSHSFGQHPAQKNKSHTCDFRFPTAKNFWLLKKMILPSQGESWDFEGNAIISTY